MPIKLAGKGARQGLTSWIGWSGLDAFGRLALLTGSTIIFSRILTPQDFGVSALILTIVTFAAVFVGAPFEDALTQRRIVRMRHFRAALGASWLIGLVLLAGSIALGTMLAAHYKLPEFSYLLPAAMASIFFSGHSDILTALARRLKRFNDVAFATLTGHAIGISLALVIAFLGYGILALIAQRLLVVVVRAVVLQWRLKFLVLPGGSVTHVAQLARFAGVSFLSRLVDNFTYLVFNTLVQAIYGFTVLGYVNMAMRLIEPMRGAIIATSHNLAFTFFARSTVDPERFRSLVETVVSRSAYAIAPVFIGLAVVAPTLLPMVTGPGWDDAIDLTICLAIASCLAVPSNLIFTACSAAGRPEFSLASLVIGLISIVAVLVGCSALGPISVGLSRIVGDAMRALVAITLPPSILHLSRPRRLGLYMPAWMLAAGMGAVVVSVSVLLPAGNSVLTLLALAISGVAAYAILLRVFARPFFDLLLQNLPYAGTPAKPGAAE